MPSVSMNLQEFHSAAEERFGDFVVDLSDAADGSDKAVFPNPMRLSDEAADWVENIQTKIAEAQADPPEVEAARAKHNATHNRYQSLGEDAPKSVVEEHERRLKEEREAYDQAVKEHGLSAAEQRRRALGVIEEFVRVVLDNPKRADRFIEKAIAGDLTRAVLFVEKYKGLGQVGEASPSGS